MMLAPMISRNTNVNYANPFNNTNVHLGGSLYLEKGFNVLEVGRKLNWGKCLFSVEKWMMAASS